MWPFRNKKEQDKKKKFDKFLPLKSEKREEKNITLRKIKEPQKFADKRKNDEQVLQMHEPEQPTDLKFPDNRKKLKLVEYNPEKIFLEREVKPEIKEIKIKEGQSSFLNTRQVMKNPDEFRLENFIRNALSKGYTKEKIRQGLVAKGWPAKLIDKILWKS